MEGNLFDFDFSEKVNLTEDELLVVFRELQEHTKSRNNPNYMSTEGLSLKIKNRLIDFEERGWIKLTSNNLIKLEDEFTLFHTVDELLESYEEKLKNLYSRSQNREDICWYRDFVEVRNHHGPIRYKNEESKTLFYNLQRDITKKYALKLGLQHFYEVPTSRGAKMETLDSKWQREHVVPMLAKHVIPITDIDELDIFFEEHGFFCGRRDWNSQYSTRTCAEVKYFSPTEFALACLAQAETEKQVKDVFDYMGYSSGGLEWKSSKVILYPEGWSKERYEESLTKEELKELKEERESFKKLYG